jgi:hypothetical protein
MKFSDRTLTILKSFSSINKSIMMKPGNVLKTITPEKTLIAIATIPDEIPSEACIYDLSRFLSMHGLYESPDVEFKNNHFVISENKSKTKYVFADASMIHSPGDREIKFPDPEVQIEVPWAIMDSVLKAAGVLKFKEEQIAFVGEEGKCYLRAIDGSKSSTDTFGVEIGDTEDTFSIIIKKENLKLLAQDYHVSLSVKGLAEFKSDDVTYYIGVDKSSTYKKG